MHSEAGGAVRHALQSRGVLGIMGTLRQHRTIHGIRLKDCIICGFSAVLHNDFLMDVSLPAPSLNNLTNNPPAQFNLLNRAALP